MKKSVIITLLVLFSFGLYAGGTSEDPNYKPYYSDLFVGESLSNLTGILKIKNRVTPELVVGNKVYYLLVGPARHHYPGELKNDEQIIVEGYILTQELVGKLKKNIEDYDRGYRFGKRFGLYDDQNSDVLSIIVTTVTIGGKKFQIDNLGYGRGFRRGRFRGRGKGRHGGPKGKRGHKGGGKRKHWR